MGFVDFHNSLLRWAPCWVGGDANAPRAAANKGARNIGAALDFLASDVHLPEGWVPALPVHLPPANQPAAEQPTA